MCIEHVRRLALAPAWVAIALPAQAQALKPELGGVAFLLGDWTDGKGQVSDMGGPARGASHFEPAAGGGVLLRRDHTELFGREGQKLGGFDQIMMIYPEGGTLHGDYADGTHVIHYVSAAVVPGKAVTFTSAASVKAPTFKLAYTLGSPAALNVSFSMAPPGTTVFRAIATGRLTRDGGR